MKTGAQRMACDEVQMENIEIIFSNIKLKDLENLLFEKFELQEKTIIRSHFYDRTNKRDVNFKDVSNLKMYFSEPGTGNIFLEELDIGIVIQNVLIIISFDKEYGDVVLNFEENEAYYKERLDNYKNIIETFIDVYKNIEVEKIALGYEPAEDDDMRILTLDAGGIHFEV